jgi:RNA polymerase sigma-70 factor, ECF subfamily
VTPAKNSPSVFEAHRRDLVALAYRMLGDLGRSEDMVQEAWLRWARHESEVASPKAFLVTVVTRLCLNELDSARARREESRGDRLPEPVALGEHGMSRMEQIEQVSMGFLLLLQRLSPAERAVLVLHDVFDFDHDEIAEAIGNNAPACRKLLERARAQLALGRRALVAPPGEHRRLLHAFLGAATTGDISALVALLADDAVMISDGGSAGRASGGLRNLPRPLSGAAHIAAFVVAATSRAAANLQVEERELNGQPAVVFWLAEEPFAALLLGVDNGKIARVFFHADLERLRHLGPRTPANGATAERSPLCD